jgi:hypothetical protein
MNAATARQRLADAVGAAALGRHEVAGAREAVSYGEATERDVRRGTVQLARLEQKEAQCRTDLEVAERVEAAEAAKAAQEADRVRAALRAVLAARRDEEIARYREFIRATQSTATAFDRSGGWSAPGYAGIPAGQWDVTYRTIAE